MFCISYKRAVTISLLSILLLIAAGCSPYKKRIDNIPDRVESGAQGKFHLQGIALDQKSQHIYFSFTDRLIKTDYDGNLIGSVTGFIGHLGNIDFDPETGTVYGSLEYKNDNIGRAILETLNVENQSQAAFYIAQFNGKLIDRENIAIDNDDVVTFSYLNDVVEDFNFTYSEGEDILNHKYGCSGIDGVTIAPLIGSSTGRNYLYVAYGIYGDTTRVDNDHQIILVYNPDDLKSNAGKLEQQKPHTRGPGKALKKYFIMTGNSRYGIQNLTYDNHSGNFYAFVYRGEKSIYPNYNLFLIDGKKEAVKGKINFYGDNEEIELLSLSDDGINDIKSGVRGWHFRWGATGVASLGDGYFFISHPGRTEHGSEEATLYKYRWTGDNRSPFIRAVDQVEAN